MNVVNGAASLELAYDPEGRLYTSKANNLTTTFLYDGTNLIGEYNGATVLRRYVHGTGVDEPLVWFEGSGFGTKRYFVQNYQGSVIGYTDSTGSLQEIYKYGPWGEPQVSSPATPNVYTSSFSGSRFRYTGQTTLAEANLYYYKARVYDPKMGRFLQTDPIGSAADLDLYAYVAGDPINNEDPTGLCEPFCGAIIGGALGGGLEATLQYMEHGRIVDKGAIVREAAIGAVAGGTGAGAGALLQKGYKVVQLANAGKKAVIAGNLTKAAAEGAVGAQMSATIKGEHADANMTEAAVVGMVAHGTGKVAQKLIPKPKFSRPVAPKPVLDIKTRAKPSVAAAAGANTEAGGNAVDEVSRTCRTDSRC